MRLYALSLREVLFENLPDILEQVDPAARMIAYSYGQKYSDLICTIIPSKKGLKLEFNWGVELEDPNKLLKGNGKISRYIEIHSEEMIRSVGLVKLLSNVLEVYTKKRAIRKS